MSTFVETPFEQALEAVERLSALDQSALIEIVRQRLLEQRRIEIAANARSVRQAFREGQAQYGTVDDLRRDLLDEA
jgi:hypothetical protein